LVKKLQRVSLYLYFLPIEVIIQSYLNKNYLDHLMLFFQVNILYS
jgi:hypothetical protein